MFFRVFRVFRGLTSSLFETVAQSCEVAGGYSICGAAAGAGAELDAEAELALELDAVPGSSNLGTDASE